MIKDLKSKHGIVVRIMRCDNAGENLALQRACEKEGLGVRFELTAPGTPQQNVKVERKFPTLYGRMRAMFHGSNIKGTHRHQLWAKATLTAPELDQILVEYGEPKNSFEKCFLPKAKGIVSQPRVFGETVIVTDRTGIKSKLADRGRVCGWVGYAADHAAGIHRVLNPVTKKISLTRNVIFSTSELRELEGEERIR